MKTNVIENFKKLRKLYCDDTLTTKHQTGEWELHEQGRVYKEYVKKCVNCGTIMNKRVVW
jgi:hypothetical protein